MAKKIKTSGFSKEELETFDNIDQAQRDADDYQEEIKDLTDVEYDIEKRMGNFTERDNLLRGKVSPNDLLDENNVRDKGLRTNAYSKIAKKINDLKKDNLANSQKVWGDKGLEKELGNIEKSENFERKERYRKEIERLANKKRK